MLHRPTMRYNIRLCCTNNANGSRVSRRSTFSNSTTCIALYTHRCNRPNYRTASMRWCSVTPCNIHVHCNHDCNTKASRTCYIQTSSTTDVVDDIAYSSASAPSWMRTTLAVGQISRRYSVWAGDFSMGQKKRNFYLHLTKMQTPLGMMQSEFPQNRLHQKTRGC